jgi:hypothetical protein
LNGTVKFETYQCTEVPVVTNRVSVRDLAIDKHIFDALDFLKLKHYFLEWFKSTQAFKKKKIVLKMTKNTLYENQYDSKCALLRTMSFWPSKIEIFY